MEFQGHLLTKESFENMILIEIPGNATEIWVQRVIFLRSMRKIMEQSLRGIIIKKLQRVIIAYMK